MRKFISYLKFSSVITIALYIVIYIITSFVMWDIKNPFQWIIDIPKYKPEDRGMLLWSYFLYHLFLVMFFTPFNKKTLNEKGK